MFVDFAVVIIITYSHRLSTSKPLSRLKASGVAKAAQQNNSTGKQIVMADFYRSPSNGSQYKVLTKTPK